MEARQVNDPALLRQFREAGAIVTDSHFVYSSGRHSSVYVNKDALYIHTGLISSLCQHMAEPYNAEQIDVVVGPVMGGIILAQWTAYFLNKRRTAGETLAIYAEKESDGPEKSFAFHRGYESYIPGKNILVVEDVLTTGGSVKKVVEVIRRLGGNVIGISALCNRGNVGSEAVGGVPIHALLAISLETYTEEECPFCKRQVPINTELGKGRAFLARKQTV